MDIRDWYAPESPDDVDEEDRDKLGLVQHGGRWYTPDQARSFARAVLALAAAAEAAGAYYNR